MDYSLEGTTGRVGDIFEFLSDFIKFNVMSDPWVCVDRIVFD
jgi:hypothetical protein